MRWHHVGLVLLVVNAVQLHAQDSRGRGISGMTLEDGTHIAYVRDDSRTGAAETTRLAAAVLWRATEREWDTIRSPEDRVRVRAMLDSAIASAKARGHQAAGTMTLRGRAWVEFDPKTQMLLLRDHRVAMPGPDSTVVVLVDGVHAGAPATTVVVPSTTDVDWLTDPATAARGGKLLERHEVWLRDLRTIPEVRSFLASPPPRD